MLKVLLNNNFPQSLRVLLIYTFIMIIGFTMLMPLVAVHFVNNMGMAAAVVGAALGVRQITQQGLTLCGGMLADKFGYKAILCLGVLLRSLGFLALAWTGSVAWLFFALILSALGGALFEAPYQALIAQQTDSENRDQYYLVSNFVGGIATALGPLIGVALLAFDFSYVCYIAALCFFINYLIAAAYLPKINFVKDGVNVSQLKNMGRLFKNHTFLMLILILVGYWFTAIQVNITFPLWAAYITGNESSVGIMYSMIAVLTIVFQLPLVNVLSKHLPSHYILLIGIVIMSLSIMMIGLFTNFYFFLSSVALFTLGALLTKPTQQTLIANHADRDALGLFMGFSSLSLGIGGGIGSVSGGWLFDMSKQFAMPSLPWMVFGCVGLICAASLYGFIQRRIIPNF